ncbi:TPA: polysaccharide biosynthesis tyrosine autokinase [Serratia fonticola]
MSNKNENAKQQANEDIDFGRLIGVLLDARWLIIGVTVAFTTLSILLSIFLTPQYKADALIQVEKNVGSSILNDITQMLPNSQPESATEIELIKSRMILGKTVDELNLRTILERDSVPIIGDGISRLFGNDSTSIDIEQFNVSDNNMDEKYELKLIDDKSYILSKGGTELIKGTVGEVASKGDVSILINAIDNFLPSDDSFTIKKISNAEAISNLLEDLSVTDKGKDTGVLELSLVGKDKSKIVKVLDSISKNYVLQNVERKSEEAGKSLSFLNQQLPDVRSNLESAENKLNQFRQTNDSIDLSLEAKSVLDTMVAVESQLNELTFKESEISKLYTKEHPAYRALMEKRKTLEGERTKLDRKISSMPKTQQEILRLTRDVSAGQQVYMQLLSKQQELSINKASTVGNVRIVDSAVVQDKPVSPKKGILVVVFTIFGFIISTLYVLVKSAFHRGIENPSELDEMGINVYASIPLSETQKKKDSEFLFRNKKKTGLTNSKVPELLAVDNPADLSIESIRGLRTSLHFAMLEAKNNVLLISGPSPGIGKTFVSSNLAAVIAQAGKKVLFVDADMRKGFAHLQFNYEATGGLSDMLSSDEPFEKYVKETYVDNLSFISRGAVPPNPSELLMRARFENFVRWAEKNYDLVLIDSPPILAVTDGIIIGKLAGTCLLVAKFGENSSKEIEICVRRLEQNGIDFKGVILNAMVRKASNEYSYEGYGYYAYSYKNESDKK